MQREIQRVEVAIIGAGLTGLCIAHELQKQGRSFCLFEASQRVGGQIRSVAEDGCLLELGPNSIFGSEAVRQLFSDLSLEDQLLNAGPEAKDRFIATKKAIGTSAAALHPLPKNILDFFSSPLLSPAGKLRLLLEPFAVYLSQRGDCESMHDFASRHFGEEFATEILQVGLGGIWAGSSVELSAEHALPRLSLLAEKYRSVFIGALLKLITSRISSGSHAPDDTSAGKGETKRPREIYSFRNGLEALPKALAATLSGDQLRCGYRLVSAEPGSQQERASFESASGWKLTFADNRIQYQAEKLLLCVPASETADILTKFLSEKEKELFRGIPYAAVGVTHFSLPGDQFPPQLSGFGFLQKPSSSRPLLGAIFNSRFFPQRAPKDLELITCLSGGRLCPAGAAVSKPEVRTRVRENLAELMQLPASSFSELRHTEWPAAIPQYVVGHHPEVLHLAGKLEVRYPGLRIAANWRGGIGLGDRVLDAINAAREL